MDKLSEVVINYINMRSTGALFITGDWGSGKTFHIKNKVFKKIEQETGRIPIIVSLFGEAEKSNLAQKVMFAYLDKKGKEARLSTSTVAKNLKHILDSFPKLKEYVDLEKLAIGTGENLFRILPHENLVIVFDDLERMSDNLSVDDFLGIVNDLIENDESKVLLIANESEIKGGIEFKEKTIEKTFHFIPDMKDVFNSITRSYSESNFRNFVDDHKEFFLKSIDMTAIRSASLRKSYSNIRTLKFALEHFNYVFKLFPQKKSNFNERLTIEQLRNLWYFILATSIEFRKPNNINYNDRKGLDSPPLTLFDLDTLADNSNSFFEDPDDSPAEEDHSQYFGKFRKTYYDRFNEQYIYHEVVYDLITAGGEIDSYKFRAHLEKAYHAKDGNVPPGHKILNRLQQDGYWSFGNEEIIKALNDLLKYCEYGSLNDLSSYINASVFLLGLKDLIEKVDDDIIQAITSGIVKFMDRQKLTSATLDQREMIGNTYSGNPNIERLLEVVDFKIRELSETADKEEILRVEDLFKNDIEAFVEEFTPETNLSLSSDKAVLHIIKREVIINALKEWSPRQIMMLSSLLKKRYITSSSYDRGREEVAFLERLKEAVNNIDLNIPLLSNKVIVSNLSPNIEKSLALFGKS